MTGHGRESLIGQRHSPNVPRLVHTEEVLVHGHTLNPQSVKYRTESSSEVSGAYLLR